MKRNKSLLQRSIAIAVCAAVSLPSFLWDDLPAIEAADGGTAFYISPDGNDSNDGSIDAPFRTLSAARDAVRSINSNMQSDITVYLRGGEYRISEPIVFDTRDSGTNGFRISYEAYEDEVPVLNGAVQVTGWEKHNDKLYKASLNRDKKLRNLYVNDARANMGSVKVQAQGGYGEYSITAGQADWAWVSGKKSDGIKYKASDLPQITSNFDDIEVINGTTWNENIVCSRDIKVENGNLIVLMQQPYGAIAQTPGWNAGFSTGGTHTLYNSLSFVDSPGEFYFDKKQKTLYYYPRNGEDMSTADVEAPITDQLIVIKGNSTSERVKNLSFSGITFENTDFQLTKVGDSYGKATVQAALSYISFGDSNWHNMKYEMCDTLPGAISVSNSESIEFKENIVKHTGADGISMANDVVNSNVVGNYITDITSSGITIGHPQHVFIGDKAGNNHEKYSVAQEGLCKNVNISDNLLHDISVVHGFGGCAAITAFYTENIRILSNQIKKTAYNGIHLGWGWCNFKNSETSRDNMICNNRVIECLNRLHDSGGIYTIGQMPGTIINENYVQGIPAAGAYQPTYGLHNDEGTAYIEEMDNVLEISPNVTYTINCEDFGQKHHLTIKRTYATVNKMGKNPPDSDIDPPIVVSDNVWPFEQYKICLNSGLSDEFKHMMPAGLMPEADYVFPASCETTGGSMLPIRKSAGNVIWIAPDATTEFKQGGNMTRVNGASGSIRTPKTEGEYRIYVVSADGKVLSKSEHLLRIKGSGSRVQAESFSEQSGIQTESCSEGGSNIGYIENGDYIGFKDVDFANGADSIDFRLSSNGANATIEVRLDSPDGKKIGSMNVTGTGGWQTWTTQNCPIENTTGKHNLYFVFTGDSGYLFNLNWWSLNLLDNGGGDYILGDLNHDQTVNAFDLALMKRACLTGETEDYDAADLDGNGIIDEQDVCLHRDFVLGKISEFPAG